MGPSEAEIETRLAALRRRREAIDREIADLLLYLELGRRLSGVAPPDAAPADAPRGGPPHEASFRDPPAASGPGAPAGAAGRPAPEGADPGEPARPPDPAAAEAAKEIPPPAAFAQDPVGARRYGRALVEAACAVIAQAGRPLHAGAILPHLIARGFALPGADPVAALNTRLWKRAAPGGPLIRLGDAMYALAEQAEDLPTADG